MVKVKKTRKASKGSKKEHMTIPEVRRSLEHIHSYVKTHPTVSAFRKEFKKVFGTEISEKSASEYLSVVQLEKGKQHGGAQLANPASLGYDMTPGSGGPSVLPYVAGGFQLPADSVARTCGQQCFLPPAADLGSNTVQKGGRRNTRKSRKGKQQGGAFPSLGTAFSEFVSRPFGMGSPPSAVQDLTILAKGGQFASPRPEIHTPLISTPTPVYNASIAPVSRMF
jgi:hypothetical protein